MTNDDIEQFDKVTATFRPLRTDDLQPPEAAEWIGWRGEWLASWPVEDGPYKGQWAMAPMAPLGTYLPFAWTPFCDLADVEIVG